MRMFCVCAVAALMFGCGGTQPTSSSEAPVPTPSSDNTDGTVIDVLAHVFTWHGKGDWGTAATIPWRSDGNGIGYDSTDRNIIEEQVEEMSRYGLTALVSWQGPGDERGGDPFLNAWLSVDPSVKAAILYEGENRLRRDRDRWWTVDAEDNARTIRNDLTHLYETYWSRDPERWYRRDGRFVFMLWPGHAMRGDLKAVLDAVPFRERLYIVTTEFDGLRPPDDSRLGMLAGADAVTGYGFYSKPLMSDYPVDPSTGVVPLSDELIERYRMASVRWRDFLAERLPGCELILPLEFAFDDTKLPWRDNPIYEATPEQGLKLATTVRHLVQDSLTTCGTIAPVVTLPSYNEHHEGTALEPNDRFGLQWLELVEKAFARGPLAPATCR